MASPRIAPPAAGRPPGSSATICVVRYDNEIGKGDHRHFGDRESSYSFTTPDALLDAFERDIARWNRENSHP
jgi:hypothetical protein